jgi:hypothetical protein
MNESRYHTLLESTPDAQQLQHSVAQNVYAQVFRTNFAAPGFALLSFRQSVSSQQLRAVMWELKNILSTMHHEICGKHLVYLSMGRFDSQTTTKFHLDGAPDEAFLMLGYEASEVQSQLATADYSQAAHDWGITPQQMLAQFNPMYEDNEKRLMPYTTSLTAFAPGYSHILLLNNSCLPYSEHENNLLGVMHQATITANAHAQRIINSTMIGTAAGTEEEPVNVTVQKYFLSTNEITGAL